MIERLYPCLLSWERRSASLRSTVTAASTRGRLRRGRKRRRRDMRCHRSPLSTVRLKQVGGKDMESLFVGLRERS